MLTSWPHGSAALLLSLLLSALLACGAGESNRARSVAAPTPSCAVPAGWRWALRAALPDARVREYDLTIPTSDTPTLIAWWSDAKLPPGYEDAGPWLNDPIWLAWRTDLGSTNEDADAADPWAYLPTIGGEDGPGRVAATPAVAQRLGLPALPLSDSGAPPSPSSPAGALDLVMRRIHADDAAEALASGRCEAAWLDGPARARWQLIGGRWLDRVRLRKIDGASRELRLAVWRRDPAALASARMLQAAQPILRGLGYDPAD